MKPNERIHAITIRVTSATLARLTDEADENDTLLSRYVADLVEACEAERNKLLSLRQQVRELQREINQLTEKNKADCIKSRKAGEEDIAKVALNQFRQVVDLVAQDYTWKERIKKNMWRVFRGLPRPDQTWNLVDNPATVTKITLK